MNSSAVATRQTTDWVTAKVVEAYAAKRYINRLDVMGFEYLIQTDNRHLRILVPAEQLEEVLSWFAELSQPPTGTNRQLASPQPATNSLSTLSILAFLLLGMFLGSLLAKLTGLETSISTMISALAGIITVSFAAAIASRK